MEHRLWLVSAGLFLWFLFKLLEEKVASANRKPTTPVAQVEWLSHITRALVSMNDMREHTSRNVQAPDRVLRAFQDLEDVACKDLHAIGRGGDVVGRGGDVIERDSDTIGRGSNIMGRGGDSLRAARFGGSPLFVLIDINAEEGEKQSPESIFHPDHRSDAANIVANFLNDTSLSML
jgi:hypothetical protein